MNVLITGGGRGLGKYLKDEFIKNGYNVFYTYCNSVCDDNNAFKCDLSKEEDIKALVDNLPDIDILINNAAVEYPSLINEKSKSAFMKTLEVNVVGTFLLTRLLGEKMKERKFGKIINISSNNGVYAYDSSTIDYDVSKSSINMMTKIFAKELKPYVMVNSVMPGWILTERVEMLNNELEGKLVSEEAKKICLNRFASMEDVSNLVLFLASDKCNYIDGAIIPIDGGYEGF